MFPPFSNICLYRFHTYILGVFWYQTELIIYKIHIQRLYKVLPVKRTITTRYLAHFYLYFVLIIVIVIIIIIFLFLLLLILYANRISLPRKYVICLPKGNARTCTFNTLKHVKCVIISMLTS